MKNRTVFYEDERNDDFSGTGITPSVIDETFPYAPGGFFWKAASFLLYYLVAFPLVVLINRLWFGVRVRNRKALRGIRGSCFLYGNHTQHFVDATCPAMLSFPRRAYVLAGAAAASVKGIRSLVLLLGGLILPTARKGVPFFLAAMEKHVRENRVLAVYPEAHIWPYYTGIRPFSDASFLYPVRFGLPVLAFVLTYRKRFLPFLPPAVTITLSDPVYPDPSLPPGERRKDLRDRVYAFMTETAGRDNYAYVRYIKKENPEPYA